MDYFIRLTAPGDPRSIRRKIEGLLAHGSTVHDSFGDAGVHVASMSLMPGTIDSTGELAKLWKLAEQHADESAPEHEVGDLQELTRLCWRLLSDEQRRLVAATFRDQMQTSLG